MPQRAGHRQRGFSLLEVLVAPVIFLVILTAVYLVFEAGSATYVRGERKATVQQNARVAMDQMGRRLRMAGYFPENFATPAPPAPLANPIHVATDGALAIYGDADGSGASNVFLFCLDGSTLRSARVASGVPAAYTCSTGQRLADNITSLRFTYYDASNTPVPNPATPPYQLDGQGLGGVPDLTNTAQRGAVWRVVITLTARQDVPGQGPQSYTLVSDVRLRNLN